MEEIIVLLSSLGFEEPTVTPEILQQAILEGPNSVTFTQIVSWLCSELQCFLELESQVNPISGHDDGDANAFLVELSSLLKELECPYQSFVSGSITDRFSTEEQRICLLVYLCTEAQAARIWYEKKPKTKKSMTIEMTESSTARDLKDALISLGFGKPPDNITAEILFTQLEKKIRSISDPVEPKDFIGERLFTGSLTEKQWCQLEKLKTEMDDEYATRREMLLTRLEVIIQSFQWSDRLKEKGHEIIKIYDARKGDLRIQPDIHISDIFAADQDLLHIEKTCAASVREHTRSAVNRVLIGAVPDRGGRPNEQQAPPPEVPSWQKSDSTRSQQSFSSGGYSSQRGFASAQASSRGSSSYQSYQDNSGSRGASSDSSGYHRDYKSQSFSQTNARNFGNTGSSSGTFDNQQRSPCPSNVPNRSAPSHWRSDDSSRRGNSHRPYRNTREQHSPVTSALNPSAPAFNPNSYQQSEIKYVGDGGSLGFGGYAPAAGGNFQQFGAPQFNQEQYAPRGHPRSQFTINTSNRGNRRGGGGRGPGRGGYNQY